MYIDLDMFPFLGNMLQKNPVIERISRGQASPPSEFSSRKHMYTNICGIIRIRVCSMFIDFVDPIINGFKSTSNYE